jgi:hypothetical protein
VTFDICNTRATVPNYAQLSLEMRFELVVAARIANQWPFSVTGPSCPYSYMRLGTGLMWEECMGPPRCPFVRTRSSIKRDT